MKWLITILLCLQATADPRIDELTAKFFDAHQKYAPINAKIPKVTLVIGYRELAGSTQGQCAQGRNHTIYLHTNFWSYPEARREIIFFHEMGHCLLGRRHREGDATVNEDRIRASLMSPGGVTDSDFTKHRDYYLEELFFHRD